MKNEEHLPVFGIGPLLIFPIILISALSLILTIYNMIHIFKIEALNFPLTIFGIILILIGITIWLFAVFKSKITQEILDNNLVTTGIYSHIRHPIYSAFLFISSGLIVLSQNLTLFLLPVIYWIILSIAMKKTEEKWLLEKFGDKYVKYCEKTNRFIPSFK